MEENRSAEEKRLVEAAQTIRKGIIEIRDVLTEMVPPDYLEHMRLARRERLLAWRSGIDARIAAVDRRLKASAGD